MYIGPQKILKEEDIENDFVKVTLEALEIDDIGEIEEAVYNKDDLEVLKSKEAQDDLSKLQTDRCDPIIRECVAVLYKHNTQFSDLEFIVRTILDFTQDAQRRKDQEFYGNHELKRSLYQVKDHLLN